MGIASRLQRYLEEHGIQHDVTEHRKTSTSASTAGVSHISPDRLAKGVVVKHEKGYMLVVVPASRHVELKVLGRWLKRPVTLAGEEETIGLFPDCEEGAIPPVGAAYGLSTAVDESLDRQQEIYLEGGDHRTLVRLSGGEFRRLMETAPHQRFSTAL